MHVPGDTAGGVEVDDSTKRVSIRLQLLQQWNQRGSNISHTVKG